MILLGIGSNLDSSFGDRYKNIDTAISKLEEENIQLIKRSSFYESLAYPNKNDPKFINVVIGVKTYLKPEELAFNIISVEKKLERKRSIKNEPRTCDIDILDFDSKIMNFKYEDLDFTVPHKKLINRNFVLFPLKEIFPKWIHPATKEPINILINKLSKEDKNSILKIDKS